MDENVRPGNPLAYIEHMCYSKFSMDTFQKLAMVARETRFESDGDVQGSPRESLLSRGAASVSCGSSPPGESTKSNIPSIPYNETELPIHMAVLPGGKRIALLKSMLTTACEMDCNYCTFRAGRNFRRVTFQPDELACAYMQAYRGGKVEGLFLSTGILSGGANTQNKILDTAEILRERYSYRGYLHIKIMPGAERGQVLRAMQLGDRISINLEAPTAERLATLAPMKHFTDQMVLPFQWIDEIRSSIDPQSAWDRRWPSSTTQFVVGPAGESDLELLSTVQFLSRTSGFARAYFEAFNPVANTPLESHVATDPVRQQRLYQASFLMRDYGFDLEDLTYDPQGNLPLEQDPKQVYARGSLSDNPVELNYAEREELLRVPGIGPKGAEAIIKARSIVHISELSQIKRLGILAERAAPYILLDGKRPDRQICLFQVHDM